MNNICAHWEFFVALARKCKFDWNIILNINYLNKGSFLLHGRCGL